MIKSIGDLAEEVRRRVHDRTVPADREELELDREDEAEQDGENVNRNRVRREGDESQTPFEHSSGSPPMSDPSDETG